MILTTVRLNPAPKQTPFSDRGTGGKRAVKQPIKQAYNTQKTYPWEQDHAHGYAFLYAHSEKIIRPRFGRMICIAA
jgi:hypothetical protein